MADWTTIKTQSPFTEIYSSDWNTYVRDNGTYLKDTLDALSDTVATLTTDPKSVVLTALDASPIISDIQTAGIEFTESSGTDNPSIPGIFCDDTTDEGVEFHFRLPGTPSGTPTIKIEYYMAEANSSKKVKFGAQASALSDGDAGATAKALATQDTVSLSCPDTAGTVDEATITLTNSDSMTKGDFVVLRIQRIPSDTTNDTATGDVVILSISLEYA